MSTSRYIIRLNPVDCLTLSGVLTSGLAMHFMLQGQFWLAMSCLYLSMLGDALDGMLARRFGLERSFGRYLDGFMDVLIYLVSPGLLLYLHGFNGAWSIFILLMVGAGCVRLSVFNDIGNIQESTGLAYLGMPVFWSLFLLAPYLLASLVVPAPALHLLMAAVLVAFSHAMVLKRPFFKFKKLWHILSITIGGSAFWLLMHVLFGGAHG